MSAHLTAAARILAPMAAILGVLAGGELSASVQERAPLQLTKGPDIFQGGRVPDRQRFNIRPAEEGRALGPAASSWGPGNPTLWTLYYDTPFDFVNYLNPHYINSGGLVPRDSYVVETDGDLFAGCVLDGYPECPHRWRFAFRSPQGAELYWLELRAWSPPNQGRHTLWTDADGLWRYDVGVLYWWLETWELVNCQLPNGNYTSTVSFWNGPQHIYTIPFAFTVGGNQCTAPSVPLPIGPAGCVDTPVTLSWNPTNDADTYDVVVRHLQTGTEVNYPNIHGTSFAIPASLLGNQRYSWKVRAVNQYGTSPYSAPLEFTPNCTAPPRPTAISPGGCIDTTAPTLEWTASEGATSYRVRVVRDDGHTITNEVTTTSWTIPGGILEENRRYDWAVEARNEFGSSAPSDVLSFTPHCGAPTAPVAEGPSGCTTLMPTLQWSGSNGTRYEFYVTDTEADVQVIRVDNHPAMSYTVPQGVLQADRAYHWRVRAHNDNNQSSPWSNLLSFVAQCGPPREAPDVHAPRDCVGTRRPTFSWSSVPRASAYQLYVTETDSPPPGTVVIAERPSGTTYTPPDDRLEPNTQYHWHVKAVNDQGDGPTSETAFFTPLCEEVTDEEEDRPDDDPGCVPESVGHPVSVLTGNMYLDQLDLTVSGVSSITFGRSYNSSNARLDWGGIFGPGWSHPYETNIWIRYRLLVLRRPNGAVLYYQDDDNDGEFQPRVPRADTSTIRQEGVSYVRRFRYGGSEVFDAEGRLVRLVDRVGNETQLVRDGTGKLRTIQEAGGRAVTLTYSGEQLTTVEGPGGLVRVTYGYDAMGRLETVTYGDGSGYRFDYDNEGRLKTVYDHTSRVLEAHTYYPNPDGRARTSSLADGREGYEFVYDALRTTVTDALGEVTTYDYAEIGGNKHVVRITGPCASCGGGAALQEWSYDTAGRVTSYARGAQTVATYEYDALTSDLLVERDGLSRATVYTYYPDGRVRTITGPDGSRKAMAYVAAGPSRIASAIDANRTRTSTITYTPTGQVEEVTDPRGKVTRFVYDAPGDLREIHAPEAQVWRFTYDAMGRRSTATSPLNATVTTTYDERGHPERVTNPDGTFVEYAYDLGGRLAQVHDSLDRTTRYGYDRYGRLEFSVDAVGAVTRRSYDLMSRLTGITDARGHATSFDYDALGRLSRTVHPDGAAEAFTYDALGRVSTRTDRRGVVTTYAYDPAGRLLRKSYSDGTPTATYEYDSVGRMIRATTTGEISETLEWSYDLLGRPLSESSTLNSSTVAYVYDDASNRTELTLRGMPYLTYVYDDASRLRRLLRGGQEFRFEYEASRRSGLEFPNGVTTSYRYDPQGMSRLTQIEASKTGAGLVLFALYDYDTAGNRRTKLVDTVEEEYTYDRMDRLIEVLAPNGSARFGYDGVGNRIREEAGATVLTALFQAGNRLVERRAGGMVAVGGTVNEDAHVTVDGRSARALEGRVFESEIAASPGENTFEVRAVDLANNVSTSSYRLQVGNETETRIRYDANGNLIERPDAGHTVTYRWDAENRLTRVLRDNVEIARFHYDPLGRRVQKAAGGAVTRYLYDGDDIIEETSTGGPSPGTFRYIHGPGIDEPLAREDSSGVTREYEYFHADGLGSIVKVTNEAGTVTSARRYDAWGNLLEGGSTPGFAFTGREWDPETGLYYYRARYYDPKVGRFISEDPIRFSGGINFYSYVRNSPANRRDPFGLADIVIGFEFDLVGIFGVEFGGGLVVDTDHPLESGITGNIGPAGGANVGAGLGVTIARRESEGLALCGDINLGKISVTGGLDEQGLNSFSLSVGPGAGLSVSAPTAKTLTIQDGLNAIKGALNRLKASRYY